MGGDGARAAPFSRRLALIVVATASLLSASALAVPSTRLTYVRSTGAESCPDEKALRRAVEQRLGYDPFFPWADRTIVARIAADVRGLHATVELLDQGGILQGSRELSAPAKQCAELVSGMALAISIAIDPTSVDRAPMRSANDAQDDPAAAEWTTARAEEAERVKPAADVPPEPATKRSHGAGKTSAWTPALGVGVVAEAGLAPGLGVGPAASVFLEAHRWAFGIEARYLVVPATRHGTGEISASLAETALLGCFRLGAPFTCAVASAGRFGVSGSGLARPNEDAVFVGRFGARAGADIALSPAWFIQGYADLAFVLGRQTVEIDGGGVWTSPPVGGAFGVALHRRFP